MQKLTKSLLRAATLGTMAVTGPMLTSTLAPPAWGQTSDLGGIAQSQTITLRASVKAIDLATRMVTLVGPAGNTVVVKAGDEVRNLDQVKIGDTVVVRYYASVALVLAQPGTEIPEDSISVAAARAAKGQLPAGAIGDKVVVTGLVVGVDPTAHTLSLVDPSGGLVHTVNVIDPERQAMLKQVKVGDTITAHGGPRHGGGSGLSHSAASA